MGVLDGWLMGVATGPVAMPVSPKLREHYERIGPVKIIHEMDETTLARANAIRARIDLLRSEMPDKMDLVSFYSETKRWPISIRFDSDGLQDGYVARMGPEYVEAANKILPILREPFLQEIDALEREFKNL